jgi:MFS family permease
MDLASKARRRLDERFSPHRVNFWCHVTEGAFWSFGDSVASAADVLPVLVVSRLGASNATLGLIYMLANLAFLAPALAAPRMEAVRHKKRLVLWLGLAGRLPHLLIAVALLSLGGVSARACIVAIAVCALARGAAMCTSIPPWQDLVAETIPPERTGRMFGYRASMAATMGLAAGPVAAGAIATLAFPANYALIYALSFGILMVSLAIFAMVDEIPEHAVPQERQPARHYFRDLLGALRTDADFRNFLLYRAIGRIRFSVAPFYAAAAAIYHGMDEALVVGSFLVVRRAATIVGTLIGPRLAERAGHKRVIQVGALIGAAAAVGAALAPAGAVVLYVGAVFLASLGGAAEGVSASAFALRIYPRGRRVGYSTLSLVVVMPLAMVAAPAGGWIMDRLGHGILFGGAAVVVLLSLAPLSRCSPRRGPIHEGSGDGEAAG